MPTELPPLNKLDQAVLAAGGDAKDQLDAYGYPSCAGVRKITAAIGRNPEDDDDLSDVYHSIKYLNLRARDLAGRT
jgi:hypothetical protein